MDVSLVFGIIFTLILIGAILVFGWDQIANLLGIGGEAQVARTIQNLDNMISEIFRLAEGSGSQFELSFPKEYRICFFNSSNPAPRFYADKSRTWNPGQTTKFQINQSGYNSWYFKGSDETGRGYKFKYLEMPTEKNFCAAGKTKIYIINKGYWVELEPA